MISRTTKLNLLLILFLVVIFNTACSSTNTYTHFTPAYPFIAQIKFDYPQSWSIENVFTEGGDYQLLLIREPGTPTPSYNKDGSIVITPHGEISIRSKSGEITTLVNQLDFDMNFILTDLGNHGYQVPFQKTRINGYGAWKLEGVFSFPPELKLDWKYYRETTLLIAQNRYYEITFSFPEDRIDDAFFVEYRRMMQSIEFLP